MRSERYRVGLLVLASALAAATVRADDAPSDPPSDPEEPAPTPPPPPKRSPFEVGVETLAAVRASNADTSYGTAYAQALFVFGITGRLFVTPRVAVGLTGGFLLRDSAKRPYGAETGPLLLGTLAYYAPLGAHAFFVPTLQLGGYIGWKKGTITNRSGDDGTSLRTRGMMLRVGLGFAFPITDAVSITARPELIWTHGSTSDADDRIGTPTVSYEPDPVNEIHGAMSLGAAYRF